jgi:recombination protein RecT
MTDRTDAPMAVLKQQLEDRAKAFRDLMPSHLNVEKLQRTILVAAQLNPALLQADRRTFLTACMKAAQDGLLPDGREAAIVPFKSRQKDPNTGQWGEVRLAQYLPMTFGLRKKILQSGEVTDLFASVVYRQEMEAGRFHYEEGSERSLRHRPILDGDFRPNDADIVLAYSVATFADGTKSFEVMRRYEIDDVREASQTGATLDAKGNPRDPKGPWVEWFSEMAKKTVIRRHAKSLPQSGDIILSDVEGQEMAAARSTVALLDQHRAAPATPLIEGGNEAFDPTTGELTAPPGQTAPAPEGDDEPEFVHPPGWQSEPEIVAEGFDKGTEQLRQQVEAEAEGQPQTVTPDLPPAGIEPTISPESEPEVDEVDEIGVTKPAHYANAEKQAEEYIARARSCEFLIDLRNLEKEADLVLATMPEEIAACVDTEFERAKKRLKPPARPKADA